MNVPKKLSVGDISKTHWRRTNEVIDYVGEIGDRVTRLESEPAVRREFVADRKPFLVYSVPLSALHPNDREENQRFLYQVRHGYVCDPDPQKVAGCADSDGEGTTPTVITVSDDADDYPDPTKPYHFVWVEFGAPHTINHGTALPSSNYHLIARIDAVTDQRIVQVRQFQRDDIRVGGGGTAGWG